MTAWGDCPTAKNTWGDGKGKGEGYRKVGKEELREINGQGRGQGEFWGLSPPNWRVEPPKHHQLSPTKFRGMNINVSIKQEKCQIWLLRQTFKCYRAFSFRGALPPEPPPGAVPPGLPLGALPSDPQYRLALPHSR